jgi:hypothetical protein
MIELTQLRLINPPIILRMYCECGAEVWLTTAAKNSDAPEADRPLYPNLCRKCKRVYWLNRPYPVFQPYTLEHPICENGFWYDEEKEQLVLQNSSITVLEQSKHGCLHCAHRTPCIAGGRAMLASCADWEARTEKEPT